MQKRQSRLLLEKEDSSAHVPKLRQKIQGMQLKQQNLAPVCKLFQEAYDMGVLGESGLGAILKDIGQALVKGRRARRLSPETRLLYFTLLHNGGPKVHNYVSELLLGPSIRWTKRLRAKFDYPIVQGFVSQFFDVIAQTLDAYKLKHLPFIVAEDGTAVQMRIDVDYDAAKQEVYVFGVCGGSYIVTTPSELVDLVKRYGIATTLYVYTVIPVIRGGPHLPLFAFCHDGSSHTFTPQTIVHTWLYMYQECQRRNLKMIGHTHDGDSRLRKTWKSLFRKGALPAAANSLTISNCVVEAVAPMVSRHFLLHLHCVDNASQVFGPVMGYFDPLHIAWRIRRQYLDPKRNLDLGGLIITHNKLIVMREKLKLSAADLDPKNKQSWTGRPQALPYVSYLKRTLASYRHSKDV